MAAVSAVIKVYLIPVALLQEPSRERELCELHGFGLGVGWAEEGYY
jgi:hypothetical protein